MDNAKREFIKEQIRKGVPMVATNETIKPVDSNPEKNDGAIVKQHTWGNILQS